MVSKRFISGVLIFFITFSSIINPICYKIFISIVYFFSCYEGLKIITKIPNQKEKVIFGILLNLLLFLFYLSMINLYNLKKELIYFLIFLGWGYDIFAYIIGKNFGKLKIAPRVSPNKTLEGFLGGFLVNFIFIYLLFKDKYTKVYIFFIFIFILTLLAHFGDIFISLLKRKAKVKDSGAIIPGHGGILDRIDSLLFISIFVELFVFLNFYTIFPLKI